ncbi:MAG: hypothetical protein K8R77_11520, partial [Anaerolineaceae bacterium]|nr:hypothetical protein [Anaerolineaceae bacterium]
KSKKKDGGEDKAENEVIRKAKPRSGKKSKKKKQSGWKIRPVTLIPMALIAAFTALVFLRPEMTSWATSRIYPHPSATASLAVTQTLQQGTKTVTPVIAVQNNTVEPTEVPTDLPTVTVQPSPTDAPSTNNTPTPIPTIPSSEFVGGGYGQITFVSDRTGIMQIWTINADGSEQRQLTSFSEGACQPAWSPDGQRLAVISPCSAKSSNYYEDSQIYIVDTEGDNPKLLPISSPGDFDPAWSPDGEKIAFTSLRNGIAHIYAYHLEDQVIEELSDTRYSDMQPAWRPRSKQIAFVREKPYNHIWVMSDQGQTEFQLSTSGSINDSWPVWTPDGESILYNRTQVEAGIPWLLMLKYEDRGSEETRIPRLGEGDLGPIAMPSISPDGGWISYESWPDGRNHDIYLTTIDGSERIRLTTDPGFDFDPTWRPYASQP